MHFERIGQVSSENITVVWVPGAYELPLTVKALAKATNMMQLSR